MCWLHSSTDGLVCQYLSQHNNLRECITCVGSMGTRGQHQETETASFVHPPHVSPCSGPRFSVTGCELRPPATGQRIGGQLQPAVDTGSRLPDPGQRPPGPASGGKPNPAIPLEAARPALPHVRPRSRFWRTLVSGVPRDQCATKTASGKPRHLLLPILLCLAKHGGMARFWLAMCALYGNVLGTESVICWH